MVDATQAAPPTTTGRVAAYDLVKALGLVGVVIAHTRPPSWLFQARNFGVPTMALVAGAVYAAGQARRPTRAWPYIRRRTVQLVVPAWAFVAFALPTTTLLARAFGRLPPFRTEHVVQAVTLFKGPIGNLWVMRVFLLASLTGPIWLALRRRVSSAHVVVGVIGLVWVGYELALWGWERSLPASWATKVAVEDFGAWGLGFGLCFAFGTVLHELSDRRLVQLAALLGVGLIVFFTVRGEWVATQRWKYPPRFPYLAYAGMIGLSLVALARSTRVGELGSTALVRFASGSSLWMFLWHGWWLVAWDLAGLGTNFVLELPVNLTLALTTTWVQQRLVRRLLRRDLGRRSRWLVETVFAERNPTRTSTS